MIRALGGAAIVSLLGSIAPMQCARTPDPNERREDTPGDALWGLAADFRAHGDEASARATLKYLVDKYPSNRHADDARHQLEVAK